MFKYTEEKLANDIGKVAQSIDPNFSHSYEPDEREVTLTSAYENADGEFTIYLGNIFLRVSQMPRKERLGLIESLLRDLLTPKAMSANDFMASLALRVRTAFELDIRNRQSTIDGYKPLTSVSYRRGDLAVELVCDGDEMVSVTRPDDLEKFAITKDEAIRMAAAKIRRATDQDQWEQINEAVWISTYQDDYDFTRLVAAEDNLRFPFAEPPVVFAPSHSICLITNSTDADILSTMIEIGYEASVDHKLLSQQLWTLEDRLEWKEWQPDQNSEAWEIASTQAIRELSQNYDQMRHYLEQLLDENVFISNYTVVQYDDRLTSYSVYLLDVPSYLPLSDYVAINDLELPESESVIGWVRWPDFQACCGNLVQVKDLSPPWYQLLEPMDERQKARLLELSLPLG